MPVATDRRLSIVLLIAGVLLSGLGGVRMLSAVSTLRAQALTEAESHLSQRLPSALAGAAAAVRDQVQQLVSSDDGSSFIYITVRDANAGVLASAGSHAGVFAWLPAGGTARAWRAWLYRALSAQSVWQISDAHPITVGFGLSWIRLLTGSLSAWAVWGLLSCLGMVIVVRAAAILRGDRTLGASNPAPARIAAGSSAPCAPSNTAEAQPRTVRRPGLAFIGGLNWPLRAPAWAGNGRRSRTGARGFEMIGGHTPTRAAPRTTDIASSPAAWRPSQETALGEAPASPPARATPSARAQAPEQPVAESRPGSATPITQRPVQTSLDPADTGADSSTDMLGGRTLDLRFHPIWRGADRRILAGAWATLAWRRGGGKIVEPETLVRLAEQEGALRTFTHWIAERFVMLHANWRTLELLTVPIVLPVPSALLAFADAEDIWRDALSRISHEPADLLLQVDTPELPSDLSLPVRRAIVPAYVGGSAGAEHDLVFVRPTADHSTETAERALTDTRYPMLVGPLIDPSAHAQLLACSERVAWFSNADNDDNVYSPRAFARLMSRTAVAPL